MADRPLSAGPQPGEPRPAASLMEFYRAVAVALRDRGLWQGILGSEAQARALAPWLAGPLVWAHFWAGKPVDTNSVVPASLPRKRPRVAAAQPRPAALNPALWAARKLSFDVRRALLMCVADGYWRELLRPANHSATGTLDSTRSHTLGPDSQFPELVGEDDLSDTDSGPNSPMTDVASPSRNSTLNQALKHRQQLILADEHNPPYLIFDDLPSDNEDSDDNDYLPLLAPPIAEQKQAAGFNSPKGLFQHNLKQRFLEFLDRVCAILDRTVHTGELKGATAKEQRAAATASTSREAVDALRSRIVDGQCTRSDQLAESIETIFSQRGASFRDIGHEVNKKTIEFIKMLDQDDQDDSTAANSSLSMQGQPVKESPFGETLGAQDPLHGNGQYPIEKNGHVKRLWSPDIGQIRAFEVFLDRLRTEAELPFPERAAVIRSEQGMSTFRQQFGPGCSGRPLPEYASAANALPDGPWQSDGEAPSCASLPRLKKETVTVSIPSFSNNDVYRNVSLIGEIHGLRKHVLASTQKGHERNESASNREHLFVCNEQSNSLTARNRQVDREEPSRHKELLRISVSLLLSQAGFTSSSSRALESLCDLTEEFIRKVGISLIKERSSTGRRQAGEAASAADAMSRITSGASLRVNFPNIHSYVKHELPTLRSVLLQSRANVVKRLEKQRIAEAEEAAKQQTKKSSVKAGSHVGSQISEEKGQSSPMAIDENPLEIEDGRIAEVTRIFGHFDSTAAIDVLGDGLLVPYELSRTVAERNLQVNVSGT